MINQNVAYHHDSYTGLCAALNGCSCLTPSGIFNPAESHEHHIPFDVYVVATAALLEQRQRCSHLGRSDIVESTLIMRRNGKTGDKQNKRN